MARIVIQDSSTGEIKQIGDVALPFFPGWVLVDTIDDEFPPTLFYTGAAADARYVNVAEISDPDSPGGVALRAAFESRFTINVRDHGAVGDGTADDTTAVQAALDAATAGATVIIPGGYNFKCTAGLTASTRVHITGGGRLFWTAGLTADGHPVALTIAAAGSSVRGVTLDNPNELMGTATFGAGGSNYGILVTANDVWISDNLIDRFQSGIVVSAAGEYRGTRIVNNRVRDVLGHGGGDGTTNGNGEDRGDGICVWGAQAVITGNIVNAKAGVDARIGIHFEALTDQNVVDPTGPYADRMVTISGNVVYGKFRRGIVTEQGRHVTIADNSIADCTWWAIVVSRTKGATVTGNSVLWTRTAADVQGSSWNPTRAPFYSLGPVDGSLFASNSVVATATSAADAFVMVGTTSTSDRPTDLIIQGNAFTADTGAVIQDGLRMDAEVLRLRVIDNVFSGFTAKGVNLFEAVDPEVRGNTITGLSTAPAEQGILLGRTNVGGVFVNNQIRYCVEGIQRANGTGFLINGNAIHNCTDGINGYAAVDSIITNNIIRVTGSDITNISNGVSGNIVVNNV